MERFGALQYSPRPDLEQGRCTGRNLAGLVADGGGTKVGEQEEVASYLREASIGAEMAGSGSPARNRGRRQQFLVAAALW